MNQPRLRPLTWALSLMAWASTLAFVGQALAADPVPPAKPEIVTTLPPSESLHLYLLIGQSNMAGRGVVGEQDRRTHPRVLMFTKEKQWALAVDPLHFDKPIAGVGLGSTFGRVMAEAQPGVTIGLVPCAVGGTPLQRWEKGGDLYKQALVRIQAAMRQGTLKGILWHQGEGDAADPEKASTYAARLAGMVRDLRAELGAPSVPFVAGKLGEFLPETTRDGKPSHWKTVNEQISSLPGIINQTAVVDSSGLKHKGDSVHFDSPSLREFGRRYAKAMQDLQTGKPTADCTPGLSSDMLMIAGQRLPMHPGL